MSEDLGEKTEDATPKRHQESREEGRVARSQDLSGAILLGVGTLVVASAALWMLTESRRLLDVVLGGGATSNPMDPKAAWDTVVYCGAAAVRLGAPILLLLWLAGYLSQFGQIGWLFSPKAVQPKASKLNPLSGFKRVFGISGVVKALLDSLKVSVVMGVTAWTVAENRDEILVLPYLSMLKCLAASAMLVLDLALRLLVVLLLLGVIDFAYQRWKHAQDMKMSKQQVKDEMKQTEGDPEVKRRRMRMQQQIAMQRVSAAVPKADVIVTNPEHISIAIQYDSETMGAPRVVAKGADYLAMRIRQIALKHDIPIVERKPLARALYREVGVGQEVPPDFYAAVAEVLAYVYRLSGKMAG